MFARPVASRQSDGRALQAELDARQRVVRLQLADEVREI